MKYCQHCGAETGANNFCSNCGKANNSTNKKDYRLIIYASISLILGIICFIPQMYLSKYGYLIAGAYVSAEFGDNSELNKFKTLTTISEVGLFLGIAFCVACAILVGFYIHAKYKKAKEVRNYEK